MQAIIIYYSLTSNTKQASIYVKNGLESEDTVVTLVNSHKATPEDLKTKDIVIFGSPVHVGAPAMELRRFLNTLPEGCLANKRVALFVTFSFWGSDAALNTMEEIVRDKGASGDILRYSRRTSFIRSLWNMIRGSSEDEIAWMEYGKLIATS